MLFALLGIAGLAFPGDWAEPGAGAALLFGLVLAGLGAGLAGAGLVGLRTADALTAVPRPRDEARLVETGAYRLVRHPVYGGLILAAAGWALVRESIPALLATVILLGFFDLKRRREEAWLAAHFAGYEAYRRRTRSLIPWLY